ncbi:hypothetical protein K443DRAFT_676764 [Laccaria amethystina LaAM-08-1]|uniref:Uncharacterized protein n=1 Tax=Laccaria amethystina LaAM-08-1 TaxID=1095629 RepID=A0A0C9Y0D7_9AGAR|nr:hypothetical protein K443DRAFT_676764 [Laccaria amethystina LaAM-08-1]
MVEIGADRSQTAVFGTLQPPQIPQGGKVEDAEPSRDRLPHASPRGSAFITRKLRSPGFRVQRILKRYKNPGPVPVIEASCS